MKSRTRSARKAILARTPKVYLTLYEFNRHCEYASGLIDGFARGQPISVRESQHFCAQLEELRGLVSQQILELLDQQELATATKAWRKRRRLEKRISK
jgi:hypothetical protein